jgi:hypothetical protein
MTTQHTVDTILELIVSALLIYGFMNEEKFVIFEQNIKRIAKGHYNRIKRELRK